MNLSKFLGATVATAAVVGAIGLTYAQSTMDKSGTEAPAANSPSVPATPPSGESRPADQSPASSPGSMSTPSNTTDSGTASERVARADRY